jgi:rfaE bifunctional protein nucleotidyltransferase chain/domain
MTAHAGIRRLIGEAAEAGIPIVWDPHPRGHTPIGGVKLVTPNRAEAAQLARDAGLDDNATAATSLQAGLSGVATGAHALRSRWGVDAVAVTLGGDGALVVHGEGPPVMVAAATSITALDTCGAGDALSAAAAVAIAGGCGVVSAVQAGVEEATRFVASGAAAGLGGARTTALAPAASPDLALRLDAVRRRGGTVVATGGCFDVLHPGHISTLQQARRMGDMLVVLINSDASVRRLKGDTRPAQRAGDRAAVLTALECVDEVIVFDDDTPVESLRKLRPDLFVKGGDYSASEIPEAAAMAEWGGVVVTVPFVDGRSTTRILDRLIGSDVLLVEHSDVV